MPIQTAYRYYDPVQDVISIVSSLPAPAIDGNIYLPAGEYTFRAGQYNVANNVVVPSNTMIIGQGIGNTVFNFSGSCGFVTQSTNAYSTGTVTAISGVNVTGSGTAWLENVIPGQSIFIGTQWYPIAVVTSDTTLIIAQTYGDDVSLPTTYKIATITSDVNFSSFSVENSTGTGLSVTDSRIITLQDIATILNSTGISFVNVSQLFLTRVLAASSTNDGIDATNVGLTNWVAVNSVSNGGYGVSLSNVKNLLASPIDSSGNVLDGVKAANAVNIGLSGTFLGNGGNDIYLVTSGTTNQIYNSLLDGNGNDGIKVSVADSSKIYANNFEGNANWGIEIANPSTHTIILGNELANNISGAVSDSGVGTLIRSNIGVADLP